MLLEKLTIPLRREKVDSHIEDRVYKEQQKPHGDKFSIRLNTVMDKYAEKTREAVIGTDKSTRNPQVWYEESQVIVKLKDHGMIYGDVAQHTTFFITKDKPVEYLMSKNKHWTRDIYDTVDWEAMGSVLRKMKDTVAKNVIKMVHGWQHDGHQKDLFYDNDEEFSNPAGCGQK